ncbi:MAG: dihydroneopterin aldolase [Myxococcota bacterium]
MADRIDLHVDLACIVGILPRERVEPQPLEIDIGMVIDLDACGWTGDLTQSVDYGSVDTQARFLATHGRFRLIESLSVALLRLLLAPPPEGTHAPLLSASVRIAKPTVLRSAIPAVNLERPATWAAHPPPETRDGCTHRVLANLTEVTAHRIEVPAGVRFESAGVAMALESGQAVALPFTADHPQTLLWVQSRPWTPPDT